MNSFAIALGVFNFGLGIYGAICTALYPTLPFSFFIMVFSFTASAFCFWMGLKD